MRLLITGATGFVGRNLLLRVLQDPNLQGRWDAIETPVRSPERLFEQLKADGVEPPAHLHAWNASSDDWRIPDPEVPRQVVHAAGVLFAADSESYRRVNVDGTRRLLRSISTDSRTVILSSISAVGPAEPNRILTEIDAERPITRYGQSKLEMERMLESEFPQHAWAVLRPPIIFGSRDSASLALFRYAQSRLQVKPGWAKKHYSFLSVSDLVDAILQVMAAPNLPTGVRRFFVAHRDGATDLDFLIEAGKFWGKRRTLRVPLPQWILRPLPPIVDRVPLLRERVPTLTSDRAREIWPTRWLCSPEAFETTFSWRAKQSLESVLAETGEWYRRQGLLDRPSRA